jgi:hypothetical protein
MNNRDGNLARHLGHEGESLLEAFFKSKNHEVILSSDPYDSEKDMLVDGIELEQKTQILFRFSKPFGNKGPSKPAFSVNVNDHGRVYHNQKFKCMTVARLVFVKRPDPMDPVIRIYEAPPPESRKCYEVINEKDHRKVALFLLEDLTEIGSIKDKELVKKFWDDGYDYRD